MAESGLRHLTANEGYCNGTAGSNPVLSTISR